MKVNQLPAGGIKTFSWNTVPKDWRFELLGNVCSVRRGASPRPAGDPRYFGGDIPWFKIGDATRSGSRFLSVTEESVNEKGADCSVRVPIGSLIVANSGVSLGFAVIAAVEGCIHDGWLLLDKFTAADRDFLYYCINYFTPRIRIMADGTTQPNLNTEIGRKLILPLPPITEQRAIAEVLGALDDKIELNRRMNETLEALAQSLFKSWFVDATQSALPKSWREVPFTETVEIIGGGTPKTSVAEYWGGDIPWFSVVDSPQGSDLFVIDTEKKITQAGVENSSTQVLQVGTTIITARGTVGKIALVGVPMAMNQSCYGLRGKTGKKGFHTYFVTRALVSQLQQHAHGSIFDTITRDTLAGVQVALPPAAVVDQFEEKVSPLMERILNNLCESRTLAALRDALLPKLLSGELRVPAAKGEQ
jgi:type I restriction enzyme S subunit